MSDWIEVGAIVEGPLLPKPIRVMALVRLGASVKLIGQGLRTNQVHDPILTPAQLDQLTVAPLQPVFDGDPVRFRLGIEAQRLALAYEYDPYFSLSIARGSGARTRRRSATTRLPLPVLARIDAEVAVGLQPSGNPNAAGDPRPPD